VSEMIISESDRQQLLALFAAESEETLATFEERLLELEQAPHEVQLLHDIFRAAHTLKGNASCLQFNELAAFAHVVEETLDKLRNHAFEVTPQRISQLLRAVDALRALSVRSIAGDGSLHRKEEDLLAELLESALPAESQTKHAAPAGGLSPSAGPAMRSLRVDMDKLDRMLDLTGEITVARGRVHDLIGANESHERIVDAVRELDRLSLDLQELVMSARMVPVGPALRHFHRVVRDLAVPRHKQITLVIEGNEVEVDTTVIEHLKDPLTQMIRNAVDHGIETPEERAAAGKSAGGTIHISASHESGAVVLRVADDGRGLRHADIVQRAQTLGIDCDLLTPEEIFSLIFRPGFSTAKKVTEISGRGVGMDVVLRNVQALHGSVSVSSEEGRGTTVTMRLPLTIALIEGFRVSVADETYILPVEAIVECVELPAATAGAAQGVINLRGTPIPFVRLRDLFAVRGPAASRENVVIVQVASGVTGLVVDALLGAHQTVIKPMSVLLRQVTGLAGSSILGNGRVALILDPEQIVRLAAGVLPRRGPADLAA
jgi:two-component system, chemotaxis family, sensor kinase CheA